jgi:hypothetical protein
MSTNGDPAATNGHPDRDELALVESAGMNHAELTAISVEMARNRGAFLEEPLDTTLWPDDEMTPREVEVLVTRLRQLERQPA